MKESNLFNKSYCTPILKADVNGTYDIAGMITKYGDVDLVGDVLEKGALTNFINNYEQREGRQGAYDKPLPMYFQHDQREVVGYWTRFDETDDGVMGFGKFYDTQKARDLRNIVKDENSVIGGFSIGFVSNNYEEILDEETDKFMGYRFKEITLKETSIVTNPAMPAAKISEIKSYYREDGSINLATLERSLRYAGASKNEAKKAVHHLKDYILVHVEVDCRGDEVEDGEMSADAPKKDDVMDEMEATKLLEALSSIKNEQQVKNLFNSLKD